MSTEVTTTEPREVMLANGSPGAGGALGHAMGMQRQGVGLGLNAGSVTIEIERAIAETKGKLVLAKQFPRSILEAYEEFMLACSDRAFAEAAFYSVPNRGSGPSIRFAEELARCYGNMDYGHRELSRMPPLAPGEPGTSEVEVYAWDMEKNNFSRRQITVPHIVDVKNDGKNNGQKIVTSQSDIDNLIANKASKQMRGRILAVCSKAMQAAGIERCKQTLAGKGDKPIAARIQDMVGAFSRYGVTVKHLEARLGHKVEETNIDELADLRGVINALKEGAKVSEYFGADEDGVVDDGKDAGGLKTDATPPKREAAKAAPKEEPKKDPPKEAPPKEEPKRDLPKEEPKAEPQKAQEKPQEAAKEAQATQAAEKAADAAPEPPQGGDDADLF
ncbi:MAG TPA: hypothetical protein VJP88_08560 [Caulobacteraceae bacterium]|nr:hypothetical protein [Caulobacteraceae bacterium]